MIKVVGKTNPFLVTIASESVAFNIDSFFEIIDSENENPVCRIIKTEHLSNETVKSIEKELAPDIEKFFPDCDHLYIAKAKIESYIKNYGEDIEKYEKKIRSITNDKKENQAKGKSNLKLDEKEKEENK